MTINAKQIIGRIIPTMQSYKYLLPTIEGRVYFVNTFVYSQVYFFLQLLPFHEKDYALLRKFVGYFIWHNSSLRLSHPVLTLPYAQGGLQLKDVKLQSRALRTTRLLSVICHHNHIFSYDYIQLILSHIDPTAPVDIQGIKNITPFSLDVFTDVSYFLIARIDIDNFTTNTLYIAYSTHNIFISCHQ